MIFAFLQTAQESYPLLSLGVGGGIAAIVVGAWRLDRKESQERYAVLAKESQERYASLSKESGERAAAIANDFRVIVQDNTRAITALTEKMTGAAENASIVELLVEMLKRGQNVNVEP